jgi:FMN phosphatase YigB (HAD superfamily)
MAAAVLFDLEGTLVQTPWEDFEHVLEFRRETKRKLVELRIPPRILEGIEFSTLMRNRASEHVDKNFDDADARRFHQEMEDFLKRYELDAAWNSRLLPETISTLRDLRRLRTRIGLVTNT